MSIIKAIMIVKKIYDFKSYMQSLPKKHVSKTSAPSFPDTNIMLTLCTSYNHN